MTVMGDLHQLILRHGVDGARSMAASKAERQAVDAAAFVMADEENRLGITHAGFAMTSLPHKRIDEGFWKREGHPAPPCSWKVAATGTAALWVCPTARSPG